MLLNVDQAPRQRKFDARKSNGNTKAILFSVITLMLMILSIYLLSAASASYDSIVSGYADNLMSTERAEYMMLFEHGQTFDEGDMQ